MSRITATALLSLMSFTSVHAEVTMVPQWPLQGSQPEEWFGYSVGGGGDVNNDGYDDVIIGVVAYPSPGGSNTGLIHIRSGRDGTTIRTIEGQNFNVGFGRAVANAGDVNNDGFDDVIAGMSADDTGGNNAGAAVVYSGMDGSVLHTWNGTAFNQMLGSMVCGAGDVNNDGFDDVMVTTNTQTLVYSGANGSVIHAFAGSAAIGAGGDINNDGFDDVIIGARAGGPVNVVYVYSGATGNGLRTIFEPEGSDDFGTAVAGAGDVNNDGVPDIIVGAHALGESAPGEAFVYSGADWSLLHHFEGVGNNGLFGSAVSAAGDVNADGFDDVMVGAPFPYTGSNPGVVRVFSGADGSVLYTFSGVGVGGELFGSSLALAGDLNGDTHPDLIIGAYREGNNGNLPGAALIVMSVETAGPPLCEGDTNGDGEVNFTDLNAVLSRFGLMCP